MNLIAFTLKNRKSFSDSNSELIANLYERLRKGPAEEVLVIRHDKLLDIFAICPNDADLEQHIIESVREALNISKINIEKKYLRNEALHYFFNLISGKYEKLIGETAILIKIKEEFNLAMDFDATGPIITRLYRQGIEFSQELNQSPELKKYFITRREAVIDISRKISENIGHFQVLFLAQEKEKIEPFIQAFKSSSLDKFLIFAPKFITGYEISSELGCTPVESDQLQHYLSSDTIIIDMEKNPRQIRRFLFPVIKKNRDNLYIYFKYYVHPTFNGDAKLPNLFIQTIDQIDDLIELHVQKRKEFFATLNKSIDKEIQKFYTWLYSDDRYIFNGIVSRDRSMQKTFELIRRIASSNINVLISGATGTGKELVAQAIHQNSSRNKGRFIAVNCSAIPETLLEAELFGYEKGSFTGAVQMKKGLVELASGGTLFLDEIGDIPHLIQIKLLRVLHEREIMRIGNPNPIKVDVRIIAATNHNLENLIEQGKFRLDLYYRVNTVQIHLPPLTQRSSDIILLTQYFIDKFNKLHGKTVNSISREVKNCLLNYSWPGNIRELENIIERAVAVALVNQITLTDLPARLQKYRSKPATSQEQSKTRASSLKEKEAAYIQELLQQENMNYSKVAQLLGIGRTTLWRKMKEYDITTQRK